MRTKHFPFEYRPLSWSAISSFRYDKEQWHRKYVQGIKDPPNDLMTFGNVVGTKLATDPTFLPDVPRLSVFEKELKGRVGNIPILGFLDSFSFDKDTIEILEYKTSSNANRWTKKSAQNHGQLLFYLALCWLNYQKAPEDIKCRLVYIPVEMTIEDGMIVSSEAIQIFHVQHTAIEVLHFLKYIKETYAEMLVFADEKAK